MFYFLVTTLVVFTAILLIHVAVSMLLGINQEYRWIKSSVIGLVFTLIFVAILGF